MAAANFSIAPEDGWVKIASAPKFARVSAVPHTAQFFIHSAANPGAPAATDIGQLCCYHPVVINVTMTDDLYARVVQQPADGKKVRIDVFTI